MLSASKKGLYPLTWPRALSLYPTGVVLPDLNICWHSALAISSPPLVSGVQLDTPCTVYALWARELSGILPSIYGISLIALVSGITFIWGPENSNSVWKYLLVKWASESIQGYQKSATKYSNLKKNWLQCIGAIRFIRLWARMQGMCFKSLVHRLGLYYLLAIHVILWVLTSLLAAVNFKHIIMVAFNVIKEISISLRTSC